MCRLFGLVCAQQVDLAVSLTAAPAQFRAQGQSNPDGWGLGFFAGGIPGVHKEALPAREEISEKEGVAVATSRIFVAHVRHGSRAPRARRNSHPFTHDGWLFAHTGALFPLLEKWVRARVGKVEYEGQTESEALFRWVLLNVEKANTVEEGIHAAVQPLIADRQFSSLNFLLARRDALFAFRYAVRSASYYSLWYLIRPPGREFQAESREVYARLRSEGLVSQQAVLIASEVLTPEGWQPLEMGQLLCVTENLEVRKVALV